MAIRTKKYESNGGRNVRAVKVTERNFQDLVGWVIRNSENVNPNKSVASAHVNKRGDVSNQRLRLHIDGKGVRVARVGDYVFHELADNGKPLDGILYILKGDVFEDKYTEIKK